MAKQVMYESPKKDNPRSPASIQPHRSDWIDAGDTPSRQTLEGRGWTIVAERDEPAEAEPASPHRRPPPVRRAGAEVAPTESRPPRSFRERAVGDYGLTEAQTEVLMVAGYRDEDALRAASDNDLRAVEGIGPATVRNLRKALKASVKASTPVAPQTNGQEGQEAGSGDHGQGDR